VFLRNEKVRDEQNDLVEILRICPVLQAKIQNTLPELRTGFPYEPPSCCCDFGSFCTWRKFRTQVASFVYFLFFAGLNYACSTQPANLKTRYIIFYNLVGQWIIGYLAIAVSIVIVFYILWYRSFKNSSYVFSCGTLLLYLLFQAVSVGIGYLFFFLVDHSINLVITSFVVLPVTAVSFSAFFGIWVSNDFNGYELSYLQGRELKPEQIEAYSKMSCLAKLRQGAWRPRTVKDWVFFVMLVLNIVSILTFLIATAIVFKPVYVAVTIALLILVFETAFITIW